MTLSTDELCSEHVGTTDGRAYGYEWIALRHRQHTDGVAMKSALRQMKYCSRNMKYRRCRYEIFAFEGKGEGSATLLQLHPSRISSVPPSSERKAFE